MKSLTHTIIEYQSFGIDDFIQQGFDEKQAKRFFNALENFAKEEKNKNFLGFNRNKLKAQNYVGIIQTPYGTLEILPKCFSKDSQPTQYLNKNQLKEAYQISLDPPRCFSQTIKGDQKEQDNQNLEKKLFINLLKTLKDSPFKHTHISSLSTSKIPLLEIFIQMFCNELLKVCKTFG